MRINPTTTEHHFENDGKSGLNFKEWAGQRRIGLQFAEQGPEEIGKRFFVVSKVTPGSKAEPVMSRTLSEFRPGRNFVRPMTPCFRQVGIALCAPKVSFYYGKCI